MFQQKWNEIYMIYTLGYRAKNSWLINMKIWYMLQFFNVDIWWKLQSSIFKVKPETEGFVNLEIVKSDKTFWRIEPKPVGRLSWFFYTKRITVTEWLVQSFKTVALNTIELFGFKVKVAPYIAHRALGNTDL